MVEPLVGQDESILDTPHIRHWRRQAEKARKEGHQKGLQEGLQEGHEKGQKEKEIDIVKNALLASLPLESITAITNLNMSDVMRIQKELELE